MGSLLLVLLNATVLIDSGVPSDPYPLAPAEPLATTVEEREQHLVPALRELSKKESWLLEKAYRPDVHLSDNALAGEHARTSGGRRAAGTPNLQAEMRLAEPMQPVGTRVDVITTLYSIWNHESLPLCAGLPYKRPFQLFLRDHYTNQATQADTRLAGVLAAAAIRFHAQRVEIVSGYRSPKYNLMLRKKGHQVARDSQHTQGAAVDFRIHGVSTEALRQFVRGLHLGGVGYYPRTHFIHADTGRVRYWKGS
ncbi:MAG: DUF882 domain-containing protein [Polyangia bacterium]